MQFLGWQLIGWQFGPWCLVYVKTDMDSFDVMNGNIYVWMTRIICVGPIQTRWRK